MRKPHAAFLKFASRRTPGRIPSSDVARLRLEVYQESSSEGGFRMTGCPAGRFTNALRVDEEPPLQ
jgi:hypothetical protein